MSHTEQGVGRPLTRSGRESLVWVVAVDGPDPGLPGKRGDRVSVCGKEEVRTETPAVVQDQLEHLSYCFDNWFESVLTQPELGDQTRIQLEQDPEVPTQRDNSMVTQASGVA